MTQAYNFGSETHLGGGDTSAFVSPWPPLLEHSLRLPVAVPFLAKAHEDSDHMVVIAVIHRRLNAKTHCAGEVVSTVTVSCLLLGPPLLTQLNQSTEREHGPHVACMLIGMSCNTWLALPSSCSRLQRGYQECGCPLLTSNKKHFKM